MTTPFARRVEAQPEAASGRLASTVLETVSRLLAYALLTITAISMIWPFAWMISTSLKDEQAAFRFPPSLLPDQLRFDNYVYVFQSLPFAWYTFNSFKISILSTVGAVLSCSLAAFAFARLRFPGRNVVFITLLATLMIPHHVTMIPVYLIWHRLGAIDTHWPLIVPSFFGGAFGIFLLRQFFMTLPQELMDAAKIDGCSYFGIYWRIFMPLAKPALATLALFVFMSHWNDLLGPLIYLNKSYNYTLTVGLTQFRGLNVTKWTLLMAGSVISVLPMLILFIFTQQYFVRGIALTGVKG
jgi:multiple sugar transport system permease protein